MNEQKALSIQIDVPTRLVGLSVREGGKEKHISPDETGRHRETLFANILSL